MPNDCFDDTGTRPVHGGGLRAINRVVYALSVGEHFDARRFRDLPRLEAAGLLFAAVFGRTADDVISHCELVAGPLPDPLSARYAAELYDWQVRLWHSGHWPRCPACGRLLPLDHGRLTCDRACYEVIDHANDRRNRLAARLARQAAALGVAVVLSASSAFSSPPPLPTSHFRLRTSVTRVCRAERFPAPVIHAMAQVESSWNPRAVGDQGRSHGLYQIQTRLHGLTVEQARDPVFSTRWTIRRIRSFGGSVWHGVRRHNGAGPAARAYVRRVRSVAAALSRPGPCRSKCVRVRPVSRSFSRR